MKFLNSLKEGIRNKVRSFLKIDEAMSLQVNITEGLDDEAKVIKNTIWYRGDAYELSQLYSQLPNKEDTFWGAVQTAELKMRKIHTGLPSLIVDVLTGIAIDDYNGIEFDDDCKIYEDEWKRIEKDNKFNETLKEAINQGLHKGAGAFKISFDDKISKFPIIEYYPKNQIEVIKKRKRIREIIFKTNIREKNKNYLLKERYGFGYVIYELYDCSSNRKLQLTDIEETSDLVNLKFAGAEISETGEIIEYGDFMLACLFKIEEHAIYDKKTDNFDAFDEIWSQWMDAVRAGRTKEYIPTSLIPRDPKSGKLLKVNAFDNRFIEVNEEMSEDSKNRIHTEQPSIQTDAYMSTYITSLDQSLQGIISPSTLGIDTKKITDPNATAQREKEKTTMYTRGKIVEAVENTLPVLVNITFKAIDTQNKQVTLRDVKASAKFGAYANPSFEAQVETVGKGKTQGVMSIEASVDELYGDSKSDKWKKEEVARLKAEQGIVDIEEPAVNFDLEIGEDTIEEQETTLKEVKEKSKKVIDE